MTSDHIVIRGARQHNLKNFDLSLPKGRFIVITGVSGSGKSSLAFDTLFAEGRRRYVESLSTQARLFLQNATPVDVDSIEGLSPAIALEQKGFSQGPRSTVGTLSEILDHLRILFTHLGKTHCSKCDQSLQAFTVPQMAQDLFEHWEEGSRFLVLAPVEKVKSASLSNTLQALRKEGYARIRFEGHVHHLDPLPSLPRRTSYNLEVVIDRLVLRPNDRQRLMEALELALKKSDGTVKLFHLAGHEKKYSETLQCPTCKTLFEKPAPSLFSFHHPKGACEACSGLGTASDPKKSPPPSAGKTSGKNHPLLANEPEEHEEDSFPDPAYSCGKCGGSRFNEAARSVRLHGLTIDQVLNKSMGALQSWISSLPLTPVDQTICERPLREILDRIATIQKLGLDYLTPDRATPTLSGGEVQRLRIARQVTSSLSGVLYVLDEPSVGLHMRDHHRLLHILFRLRDEGNTVIVVEHDRDTILRADHVVDMGPGAGESGGELLFSGPPALLEGQKESLTGAYLSGTAFLPGPSRRKCFQRGTLLVKGARGHNLKNITARFPLGCITCVTGVSGSGKSTLVIQTLYKALARQIHGAQTQPCPFTAMEGHESITKVLAVDQKPIGKTPRSTPATYSAVFRSIRELFSRLPESRTRGYTSSRFSYNVKGGRCESCKGDGIERVEMFFLPDVYVTCPYCSGKRFNASTLSVTYKGRSIADILDMTFMEASLFFKNVPSIQKNLNSFLEVGLGYLRLGQPATTLSGGEAQRIKLAAELARSTPPGTLFILDEPTRGLHAADIDKLLHILQSLAERDHTVVLIEHHPDVIGAADYVVDMGPEGGLDGGNIVAEGSPEQIAADERSVTGKYLGPFHT